MSLPVFPDLPGLTFTSVKTSTFNTLVDPSPGGHEVRLSQVINPIWEWTLVYDFLRDFEWGNFTSPSELRAMMGFFNGRKGRGESFLFQDPDDYSVGPGLVSSAPNIPMAQLPLINGGDTKYYSPIQRTLDGITYEDITDLNPQNGSGLQLWADGSPIAFNLHGPGGAIAGHSFAGMYVDYGGGNVPTPPITASFNFYFRVRFDSDEQDFEKFLGVGNAVSLLPPAGQGGGFWTIGGSESQNGQGTLKLRTARPAPL